MPFGDSAGTPGQNDNCQERTEAKISPDFFIDTYQVYRIWKIGKRSRGPYYESVTSRTVHPLGLQSALA